MEIRNDIREKANQEVNEICSKLEALIIKKDIPGIKKIMNSINGKEIAFCDPDIFDAFFDLESKAFLLK